LHYRRPITPFFSRDMGKTTVTLALHMLNNVHIVA
jgi:hypothetical protein